MELTLIAITFLLVACFGWAVSLAVDKRIIQRRANQWMNEYYKLKRKYERNYTQ